MIAKLIKGKGFRGALEYDLKQGKGVLLETNMAGQTPKELAREFGIIRALRPTLGKAVCHVSLSIHPTEHLPMNSGVRQRKGGSQGWASPIINMS